MTRTISLCALALLIPGPLGGEDTRSVAEAFRDRVLLERDFEAGVDLCAEDLTFRDPTTAKWGMPIAAGVTGRDKIFATMQGFDIARASFDVRVDFTAGEFACFLGEFAGTKRGGSTNRFPFMTCLRVEDGVVTERTDYGDYDQFFPPMQRTKEAPEDELVGVSTEYLGAYWEADVATMREYMAPDAVFVDPTSAVVGTGAEIVGADAIAETLTGSFGGVSDFGFEVQERFFFDDHAVFAGTCSYRIPGAAVGSKREIVRISHAGIVVLQLRDGLVVRHTDYVDYDGYLAQVEAQREEEPEGRGF